MKKLIAWVEIPATDIRRAVAFYNKLLNLQLEVLDFGSEKMAIFPNEEGAISQAEDFKPSENGTLASFQVDDINLALKSVVENKGRVLKEKTKIEAEAKGYFALFIDSEGNKVGLYED